ncbi:hypothetical protein [Sediminicurvatus halobius]|uniref:Uncharacterized protein n=1 Tax=Sediminicurvatus halobius TaxID=2182432 RepID=A0A2U2N0S8_9GAMM|nr:hypothetical protein [Spiribacter halobius]PWG62851.1 hypothetical protein DEM34_10820 [Spiribacter halobius]UEX76998.1 hypothetical protein LMH63_13730 [Spiribacter halobius]
MKQHRHRERNGGSTLTRAYRQYFTPAYAPGDPRPFRLAGLYDDTAEVRMSDSTAPLRRLEWAER